MRRAGLWSSMFVLVSVLPIGLPAKVFAAGSSGREFIFSFLPNDPSSGNPNVVEVHFSADQATDVLVEYPAGAPTFTRTVNIAPNIIRFIQVPTAAAEGWIPNTVTRNSIRLSAPVPFNAYPITHLSNNTSAYSSLALPISALNTDYVAATYDSAQSRDRAQLSVAAVYDDTNVTITPSANIRGGGAAGVPIVLILNRGEGYMVQDEAPQNGGLTGSVISSDKPVSVSNGNACPLVPGGVQDCDALFEIAPPVQSWGRQVLIAGLPNRPDGSIYRIIASRNNTVVSMDGSPLITARTPQGPAIDLGQFLEVGPLTGNHQISANHPILVEQFTTGNKAPGAKDGGPAMTNILPVEQYEPRFRFPIVSGATADHFVTIVVNNFDVGHLLLNTGIIPSGQFTAIPGTSFSTTTQRVGFSSFVTNTVAPHLATVETYLPADSFTYPAGSLARFINALDDTDPPLCSASISSQVDLDATGSAVDNRLTDSGIFSVILLPGSRNFGITGIAGPTVGVGDSLFVQGAANVSYTVAVIDPAQPGIGVVRVTDGSGNSCESAFLLGDTAPTLRADENPPTCEVEPFSAGALNASLSGIDNRRSEDLDGNGVLNPGEDLNNNGKIDIDTGIALIELLPGSTNMTSGSLRFDPGITRQRYSVQLIDRSEPGSGVVRVTDRAGNTCEASFSLEGTGGCPEPGPDPQALDNSATRQLKSITRLARQANGSDSRQRARIRRIVTAATNLFTENWTLANTVPRAPTPCPEATQSLSVCSSLELSAVRDKYAGNAKGLFTLGRRLISLLQQSGVLSAREAREALAARRIMQDQVLTLAAGIPDSATVCTGTEERNLAGISSISGK